MIEDTIMRLYSVLVPFLLSAVLGWLFIPRVLILSHRKRLFDMPDERKMHNRPIPRLGGITFLPILLMCVCLVIGLWICPVTFVDCICCWCASSSCSWG